MTASLTLEARIDTAAVPDLVAKMRDCAGGDLVLDAAEVTMIGALGAQALMVAKRVWDASGHTLSIANLPASVADDLSLLGLGRDLDPLAGGQP